MSAVVATPNLEPKPRPTPPNADPFAVLALALSVATIVGVTTADIELAIAAWAAVMPLRWRFDRN